MKNIYVIIFLFFGNFLFSQQINDVDFLSCSASIKPFPIEKKINGFCKYTFKIKRRTDSIFIDAKNMVFSNVYLKGKNVKYHPAGSYELANDCLDKLNKHDIVALERHGTLSIGSDVDKIFEDIETLEYYSGIELKEKIH